MIRLSNGHEFEYMAASGALGFGGKGWWWEKLLKPFGLFDASLFTAATKTLTSSPIKGNSPLKSVRFVKSGVVNAVALRNPGFIWWCRDVGTKVIVSISGEPQELGLMAAILKRFNLNIIGFEINASCSNINCGVKNTEKVIASCHQLKEVTSLPVILKLSIIHDIEIIIKETEDMVGAFSINSVPWHIVFPKKKSPLSRFGGGAVSGKVAQPHTWGLAQKLVSLTDIPVVFPSIWNYGDIEKARRLGAKAISFGSVFLRYPWRPTLFVRKDQKCK